MGILSWIVFGLLAGLVARMLVRGTGSIGCLGTLAVGIVGALLGGLIGEVVFDEKVRFDWDLKPFLLAVLGAVAFLLMLQALGGRRR